MNYQETLDYLYARLPMFHRIGPAAYKADLTNTIVLCQAIGNPQNQFKSIHIAGTNGKGSVSHMIAASLQSAGYKTGLYTSPHLVDFRERIRIDGQMIPENVVIDFVEQNKALIEQINPSFFEVTVALAFRFFAMEQVDYAVIETGLGGRLDSTNIISPLISIITNISYDHQNLLGDTLEAIASEKAGIIKPNIPVIIGKRQPETETLFIEKANEVNTEIYFAQDLYEPLVIHNPPDKPKAYLTYKDKVRNYHIQLSSDLKGGYQIENIATVLSALSILNKIGSQPVTYNAIREGINQVRRITGLRGRWEILNTNPLIICDVAHNEAGLKNVFAQLSPIRANRKELRIIYGMVNDKNREKPMSLLPKDAKYYFCSPNIPRGLDVEVLQSEAVVLGLDGNSYPGVLDAYAQAIADAGPDDIVLVTGSIFVVAEVLAEN